MGTKRGEGKRASCVQCSQEFPARGRQIACSTTCSELHKAAKRAARLAALPIKVKLCTDKSDKAYILDRILVNEETGCWEWQKSLRPQTGYGQVGGYPHTAHRLSYMLWKGELGDLLVRHNCHNRICCNPEHLVSGTKFDNWHDSEEMYLEMAANRRGRPAKNRVSVTLRGVTYASKSEAREALGVGEKALNKLIKSEQSEAA